MVANNLPKGTALMSSSTRFEAAEHIAKVKLWSLVLDSSTPCFLRQQQRPTQHEKSVTNTVKTIAVTHTNNGNPGLGQTGRHQLSLPYSCSIPKGNHGTDSMAPSPVTF
jgi:hypothetical protein